MSKKKMLIIGSLFMWILFLGIGLIDVQPNILTKKNSVDMTTELFVVKDLDTKYSIDEITKEEDDIYIKYSDSDYSGRLSKHDYWFKLHLSASDQPRLLEVSKAQLAEIEYYQVNSSGKIINTNIQGRRYPFEKRELKYRHFIFRALPADDDTVAYFKVRTDTYLQMPITLWKNMDFFNYLGYSNIVHGLFYGMILIMLFYNLALGISLKDKNYYLYVALVISYFFLQLVWDGFAYQYLWPTSPSWDMIANPIFILLVSLTMLAFTHSFLKLKQFGGLARCYKGFIAMHYIGFISVFIISINLSIYIAMILGTCTITYCITGLCFKRLKEISDIIYLMAVQMLFIGGGMNILAGTGILKYTVITAYSTKAGGIFLLLLFSIALSTRIKQIESLKEFEAKKKELLRGLHDINIKTIASRDLHEISQHLINHFINMLKCDDGLLLLIDPENKFDASIFKASALAWSIKLTGEQYNHLINYIGNREISYSKGFEFEYLIINPEKSVIVIPLRNCGRPIGAIILFAEQVSVIEASIEELICNYANQIALNIKNIKLLDEITRSARTDDLTQIHNRRHIFEIASLYYEPQFASEPFAAIMLDIDHFKQINDRYGHSVGDQLMEQVAQHIKLVINGKGEIGRYGGDEFLIVVPNMTRKHVWQLANDICSSIYKKEFVVNHHSKSSYKISVSIGIAYRLDETHSIEMLCEYGDKALYTAKKAGRNQVVIYDNISKNMDVNHIV